MYSAPPALTCSRSTPAEKMCPCPVSTTARASEVRSLSKQSASPSHKVMSSALALPCRMVTVAIPSSFVTSIMGAFFRYVCE
jgi:hypothetical protein